MYWYTFNLNVLNKEVCLIFVNILLEHSVTDLVKNMQVQLSSNIWLNSTNNCDFAKP